MPFIGTQPEVGGYSVLDALTASATASYTLQKDSANFVPASANQLLVSLNGVIQKPGSSFTVSGSTLTFSSALDSSDSIDFILAMGEPLLVGTPSDGTVNADKLATNAVTTAKIATDAITQAKIGASAVGTTELASAAVTSAKIDNNSTLSFTKLANLDQASNTATSFSFHSILNGPYQIYRIVGYLGGTVSTGNANLGARFVTGTGTVVSSSSYHSGNTGYMSDGNFNSGNGLNSDRGFMIVATSTGTTIYNDMFVIPYQKFIYGHCYAHDQNTHIGVCTYSVRYNASLSDISGLQFLNSGGDNLTLVDATVYGAHVDGSLGV